MKHEIINFISMASLGAGTFTVSTLLVRYVPALAEGFYFLAAFMLSVVALALVAAIAYRAFTGSHDWFLKVCVVFGPLGVLAIFGITLGAIN